jgi:hypothetical protein
MYWKFLRSGARSPFTGFDWAALGGEWHTEPRAEACHKGIHACRLADLPYWITDELWHIELTEPVVDAGSKVISTRARLLERVEAWGPATARELAEACVKRVSRHAADELRDLGLPEQADLFTDQPSRGLPGIVRELLPSLTARRLRPAAKLCEYVVDASEGVTTYPIATIAYIAARAADQRGGPPGADLYTAEREWQATWLTEHLRLVSVS